jgi:alpha-glucosidase (family GH31 glycosyl hydrolase)
MGMSGIGIWGSDIGGFHSLGLTRLTPELLIRWIQFGAVSPIMRTKSEGIEVPEYDRPQIWDPEILPIWRRYAKLHTQLYPYLVAAIEDYRRSGLPVMRHLALTHPRDPRAVSQDDEYLFGPDLLVKPVTSPGQTEQTIYLPRGRWLNLWDAVAYNARTGGLQMKRPRVVRGRREVTIPAPLGELPGFIRAGALLTLLPPAVDTLSQYGGRGLVHLRDRKDRVLLLFPRGTTSRDLGPSSKMVSRERRGSVNFEIVSAARRRFRIQASMSTLKRPFRPCRVSVDGRRLPRREWDFDRKTRVLSLVARGGRLSVEAFACRRG